MLPPVQPLTAPPMHRLARAARHDGGGGPVDQELVHGGWGQTARSRAPTSQSGSPVSPNSRTRAAAAPAAGIDACQTQRQPQNRQRFLQTLVTARTRQTVGTASMAAISKIGAGGGVRTAGHRANGRHDEEDQEPAGMTTGWTPLRLPWPG